ncbi:TetR/AcrR family transcriptional regulator [Sphingomonas sp. CLY1604]|uniref:TetR/AcrR family transcriptional regulator n=1 Tax=Sphingomonas sp. CLY1604 TaxID=3457786 RepID=UPI003FD7AF9F
MARPRTLDRDQILALAEGLVATEGASALTIGGVAKAAGISKGGIQSLFGDKEGLISAMLRRWMEQDAHIHAKELGSASTFVEKMRAHVASSQAQDDASQTRAAGLLAGLMQSPDRLDGIREWFIQRADGLPGDTLDDRKARLAFFAVEGAFFLRFLGLLPVDDRTWSNIQSDIANLLLPLRSSVRPSLSRAGPA